MKINRYQIGIVASAFVAAALLLTVQPLALSAGRTVGKRPVATAAIPTDIAEGVSGREPADELRAYRQAIEDVLPLMRSLQARGDTARLAQLARSVIEVWNELNSIDPEAVPDEALHKVIEDWAGRGRMPLEGQQPADRLGR